MLTTQDFVALSDSCTPVHLGPRESSTSSEFSIDPDFANDILNVEEFDLPHENPDAWNLNLYGLSPFPFGRL
jgi:hypothetical protein